MKRLYCLNELNMEELLVSKGYKPRYIKVHLWKYYYFITKIINKIYRKYNCYGDNFYRVSTEELKNKLDQVTVSGKREWIMYRIRRDLKDYILNYEAYDEATEKSKALYKIKDEYLVGGWEQVDMEITPYMSLRMEKTNQYTGVYGELRSIMIENISIKYNEAIQFTNQALENEMELSPKRLMFHKGVERKFDIRNHNCWIHNIDDINDGDTFFSVAMESTGRVYNSITNLPKPLRQFLRMNGKPMIELDIANSQPLLFCIILQKWAIENNLTEAKDIRRYKKLCEAGKFYDYIKALLKKCGETYHDDLVKVDFFSRIFFSTEKKKYKWRKIFARQFPNVSACITDCKKDGYNKLSIQLQKIESDCIIRDVCDRFITGGIKEIFPIHDAILTTVELVDTVESVMYDAFSVYGLSPKIRKKHLQPIIYLLPESHILRQIAS